MVRENSEVVMKFTQMNTNNEMGILMVMMLTRALPSGNDEDFVTWNMVIEIVDLLYPLKLVMFHTYYVAVYQRVNHKPK